MASVTRSDLEDAWPGLTLEERLEAFKSLPRDAAADFFLSRTARSQALILEVCSLVERRTLLRSLAPDDAADVMQEVDEQDAEQWLALLEESTRLEVQALLQYKEDEAGGRMNPRYFRLRPTMNVDEAIHYVRRATKGGAETVYYAYVVEKDRLVGVLSLRELLTAPGKQRVADRMTTDLVTVPEGMDQEEVARVIMEHDLLAVPVVDVEGRMRGIVTVDDIVDILEEEATEDIQKIGGSATLDAPYLQTTVGTMTRKRVGWLTVLFIGQMLTASAMGLFEADIANAVVLALFLPLIISSGGNSGSQASTLVIRAMALGQVDLSDAGRIFWREIRVGLLLGAILASVGVARILVWEGAFGAYGDRASALAIAVGASVATVVTWGVLAGSMLPLLLRRLRFDPATASAPLVATVVDVTGVVIYFGTARAILGAGW